MGRGEAGAAEAAVQVAVMARGPEPADVLLRAARRGDSDAFMKLLAPERLRLESLATRLLDDRGEVADVLQEVYLSAYSALPKYRGDSRLGTWLYRITYNACLRHQARRRETADAGAEQGLSLQDHAASVAERLDLTAALAELPIEQRALVLMIDRDGFDYRSAAEALSIPLGTVSSRLARRENQAARRALARSRKGRRMNQDHDQFVDERRDLELGAALASLPHPELPADMDARLRAALETERRRRRRHRSAAALGLAAALAAIVLGGAALAGAFDSDSPAPWPEPPLPAESVYPTNAAGETYGRNKPLVQEPDLIAAVGRHGVHGYLRTSDIDGTPPRSPEEAEAMNKRGLRGYTVPLYESDGVTQVGVFRVGGAGGQMRMRQADGTIITQEADRDDNIITTTTHPDGTVTIETEALDGTVTTKTLTAAVAKRLKQETATPRPTATPTHEPDRPRDWLLARMTQLARDAGDARATAWWELQSRYYLKPIEGDKTPKSPYQQWATVWLVILHGDFAGADWKYCLLDQDSHNVLASARATRGSRCRALSSPRRRGRSGLELTDRRMRSISRAA